jgi:hypothetical protein
VIVVVAVCLLACCCSLTSTTNINEFPHLRMYTTPPYTIFSYARLSFYVPSSNLSCFPPRNCALYVCSRE